MQERPDAILPTMGGQTGLNLAKALSEKGMLAKYGIELIGAKLPSIDRAEDRELFKQAMDRIGLKCAESCERSSEGASGGAGARGLWGGGASLAFTRPRCLLVYVLVKPLHT